MYRLIISETDNGIIIQEILFNCVDVIISLQAVILLARLIN